MNKQQLAARIWASANKMRSKIEANEYKDYILGFIFYKFLSDKQVHYLKNIGTSDEEMVSVTEDSQEWVEFLRNNLGYFISYDNLFSTWLSLDNNFTVANVRDALSAFNRLINPNHKKLFDGIFDTLQTGLSKLGASTAEQNKAVRDLVSLIKDIPTDGRQDYDILGFVYEYLISNFAANAGKKAGEFYTPHEVSVMMSDIIAHHLQNNEEIRIYDPTSGSGSLLINIGKSVARHINNKDNIKYYAQELKQNTYNLTRMNLIMRGINPSNIEVRNGDTLKEDWPYFEENDPQGTYDPLYVDAVVSNPPYSQEWEPTDQENDPRYAGFGLAPKGVADYAFLLHDLYHVKPEGIMTIVLPHGVLYRGGAEAEIRKNLIEKNHIDAIIGLPEKVFFGTGISTIVMILKRAQTRKDNNILFVDASRCYEKHGKNNKLRECDIRRIVDAVTNRTEVADFARLVSRDDIRKNEYNLNISRYVDAGDKAEKYDLYATMFGGIPQSELQTLNKYWSAFPSLQNELFDFNSERYAHLKEGSLSQHISNNADVARFKENFCAAFADYTSYLQEELVASMNDCSIQQKHEQLTTNLFQRMAAFSNLADPYQAFQFFSNEWRKIQTDLEIIQTEGEQVFREIEVDEETHEENGRILPFGLVQKELLQEELNAIRSVVRQLEDNASAITEIFDSLTEEEKDKYANDDNTAFAPKKFPKFKRGQVVEEGSIEEKLMQANVLFTKEKALNKQYKEMNAQLLKHTREQIQSIDLDTAIRLVGIKWTLPLTSALARIPNDIVQVLTDKVQHLANKYATTYQDITNRIVSAQSRLHMLLGELNADTADAMGLNQFRETLKV